MGYDPLVVSEEQFTPPSVLNELRLETIQSTRIKLAVETGKLKTRTPSNRSLERIESASRQVGDFVALSQTDKDVLALVWELSGSSFSPQLVSDDYAVQNVAEFLGFGYVSLTTFGIRYRFGWISYCPACRRKYAATESRNAVCEVCGTRLKRRVVKKEAVRKK